jgi:hypothetical protein
MRYAQRGGYTPAEQQRREGLRLELRKGPLAYGFGASSDMVTMVELPRSIVARQR